MVPPGTADVDWRGRQARVTGFELNVSILGDPVITWSSYRWGSWGLEGGVGDRSMARSWLLEWP